MSIEYKTKGLVYSKKDRGEADRIFTIFTYDFGKLDIHARGIRKINSKLKSGIDIFYLSEIEFVQGKKKTLIDAVLINKFSEIIKTPEKFKTAKKISKILQTFIHGQEHDHEIYNLIVDTFEKLSACSLQTNHYQLVFIYFLWNFFSVLGYAPQLSNCAHCHNKLDEKELYFSNKDGGTVCRNCKNDITVNSDIIKILRIILKKDFDTFIKLKINLNTQKELAGISKNYYLYLLSTHSFKKYDNAN